MKEVLREKPRATNPPIHVTSETAELRQVVVHTPGEEMTLVSPQNREALLFDDILDVNVARQEHEVMCRLFQRFTGSSDGVLQLPELVRETFELPDAREDYVGRFVSGLPERNYQAYSQNLLALDPGALHRFALTGQAPFDISAHPLPNLLFSRDLLAVVGRHVILSHAATPARRPESILISTVVRYHPRFAEVGENLIELPDEVHFEGGDLLVVDDEIVLIGQSERTSLGGVMAVASALLNRSPVKHVLMVNLPKQRSCMHLDTVFTFADRETCVQFPPIIEGSRNNVYHLESGGDGKSFRTRVLPNLREALLEMTGRSLTFIPCGGDDPISQRREQWTDGANLFAMAPGIVLGYERNRKTFEALAEHGFEVARAADLLSEQPGNGVPADRRLAVMLTGHELSRGRGGPRCMTMPLIRNA